MKSLSKNLYFSLGLGIVLIVFVVLFLLTPKVGKQPVQTQLNKAAVSTPGAKPAATPAPLPYPPDQIVESVLLTGDGGMLRESAFQLIRAQSAVLSDRLSVVFLGDNIYPVGLPHPSHEQEYKTARGWLQREIDAVLPFKVKAVFIPGNHDWAQGRDDGWDAVKRQADYITGILGPESYAPLNGCPGPKLIKLGAKFDLIVMDSHWWFHRGPKPNNPGMGCKTFTREAIIERLIMLLRSEPERAKIFASHHPIESFGAHSHGSAYQNKNSAEYQDMLSVYSQALTYAPPLICAAGHDHSLQVIKGTNVCKHFLVSGSVSTPTRVFSSDSHGLLYGSSEVGIMRLDYYKDGALRLLVLLADPSSPQGKPAATFWLVPHPAKPKPKEAKKP